MDSVHLHFTNRRLISFYEFLTGTTLIMSVSEKKKKSFPLEGMAKANFFCFAIEKKNPPQNNELKVEFIPVLEKRVDCSKK